MFGRKRKPVPPVAAPTPPSIRDTLFADGPLESWPVGDHADREPWATFVTARRYAAAGDVGNAVVGWQRVATMPGLEARHYAQAWTFLRRYGVQPPAAEAKRLLGVVIEVDRGAAGLDLLAAYPELTARFYAGTGGGSRGSGPTGRSTRTSPPCSTRRRPCWTGSARGRRSGSPRLPPTTSG